MIAKAVNDTFNQFHDAGINMPALVFVAMSKISGITPRNYYAWKDSIENYIASNTHLFEKHNTRIYRAKQLSFNFPSL